MHPNFLDLCKRGKRPQTVTSSENPYEFAIHVNDETEAKLSVTVQGHLSSKQGCGLPCISHICSNRYTLCRFKREHSYISHVSFGNKNKTVSARKLQLLVCVHEQVYFKH